MFGKFIIFPIFLISLAVGLLFVYLSSPKPTVINVYPTPDNLQKFEYVDKAQNCFSFDYEKVKCPGDANKIKKIPIQK